MISLICTGIHIENWKKLLKSIKNNQINYEVVMASFADAKLVADVFKDNPELVHIPIEEIKPAQAMEVARRNAKGELIGWITDDCIFEDNALDKIYESWLSYTNNTILAIKNVDSESQHNDLNTQRFFAGNLNTPQMAYYGFISKWYFDSLSGIDKRYIMGKWQDDLCMRTLANEGKIIKYEDTTIHVSRSNKNWFYNNNWSGANEDSENLENSWVIGGNSPREN